MNFSALFEYHWFSSYILLQHKPVTLRPSIYVSFLLSVLQTVFSLEDGKLIQVQMLSGELSSKLVREIDGDKLKIVSSDVRLN